MAAAELAEDVVARLALRRLVAHPMPTRRLVAEAAVDAADVVALRKIARV